MTGTIVSLPPLVEQPPGQSSSNPAGLPGITYVPALLNVVQTWTAKQTFPLGNISLNAADVLGLTPSATIDTTNASNITSGTLPAARLPNPTASTLGGVKSLASVSHQWINSIGTDGTPTSTQPAFADISGSVVATQMPALTGDITTTAGTVSTSIGATKVTSAMLNADVFSTPHTWAGQQTFVAPVLGSATATSLAINPAAGSLATALTSTQTLAGTTAIPYAANLQAINTDVVNAGANFVLGWDFDMKYGGGAMQGGRQTVSGFGTLTAPSNASSPLRAYVGVVGSLTAQSADNGTNPATSATAKGGIFGGNFAATAKNGATALHNVTGAEFNVAMETGSSVFAKTLAQFSSNVTDTTPGSVVDSMLWLYNQTGSTAKWGNGIRWDDAAGLGLWPFNSSSTIIQTGGNGTANTGIDFTNTTFTGSAFKSPGFNVDGSGNVTAPNITSSWTSYTPTITSASGAITTVSANVGSFKTQGKTTWFTASWTITTNGTGGTFLSVSLPNIVASITSVVGQVTSTGKAMSCNATAGTNVFACFLYDSTYPGVTGATYVISGVYQNQ